MLQATVLPTALSETINDCATRITQMFPDVDPWIDTKAACEMLEVSEHTIRDWRNQNLMPAHRFGKSFKYRQSTIEKVKELRDEHGPKWADYSPWTNKETYGLPAPYVAAAYSDDFKDKLEFTENVRLEMARALILRARRLDAEGDKHGALALIWAAIDEADMLNEHRQ